MTPEQTELAKRLADHPEFRWRSGMVHACDADGTCWMGRPDLTSWPTIGALLGMLVEVHTSDGYDPRHAAEVVIEDLDRTVNMDFGSRVATLLLKAWGDP